MGKRIEGLSALAALAMTMTLQACASRPPPELRQDGIPFRELPAQRLAPGTCALFLWAQDEGEARRIIMVKPEPTIARVRLRQRVFTFDLASESGEKKRGFSPQMTFESMGVTFSLDLTFADRENLSQGFVVEDGALSYKAANGWAATLPVRGLVGCEPLS